MNIKKLIEKYPKLTNFIRKISTRFPYIEKKIMQFSRIKEILAEEESKIEKEFEKITKPYKDKYPTYKRLPSKGIKKDDLLKYLEDIQKQENDRWQKGYVSGAVYHGEKKHIELLNQVYAMYSQTNPLHSDLWPSIAKFEAEIISMCASLLNADLDLPYEKRVCGSISSGGTESILLAMKTYRDWARVEKNIKKPEVIVPVTAHAAFEKASEYFKIKLVKIPVDENFKADIKKLKKVITKNTIAIVGSAPSFPHGVIDPIEEMSEIAYKYGIGFHTDACLGGFILPFAERLGYNIPIFDFRLRGVTSISIDTHKYGYASKGTSVILYKNEHLRQYQYFITTDWPGGIYFSPTFAGSRAGGIIASCYASLLSIGEKGYLENTKKILQTAEKIKEGIREIPELEILGDPLWVIAFTSKDLNIYQIMDVMTQKGWNLNALQLPPSIHIAVTLRHTQKGVIERFIKDLKQAVLFTKKHQEINTGLAPIYGMAANVPIRGIVKNILTKYLNILYRV
ncbi:MAG: aspartate aminotransferase family protein [Leptospiraceae bacterium]|nr:MAG: aspartate aminotransferase family protein [Leptospiraceae bacterium]